MWGFPPLYNTRKRAQMLIFEDCDHSFPLSPINCPPPPTQSLKTHAERGGRERERGVGSASTHSPNIHISLNYVCMYTNHLCCRPHFEVEEGLSPHFANSTDDRWDREGPPLISTPSHPSISTLAGCGPPPAPTPLNFDTSGGDLPPTPSCPSISMLVGGNLPPAPLCPSISTSVERNLPPAPSHLHCNIKNPWVLPPRGFVPVQPIKTPTPTHNNPVPMGVGMGFRG